MPFILCEKIFQPFAFSILFLPNVPMINAVICKDGSAVLIYFSLLAENSEMSIHRICQEVFLCAIRL